MESHDEKMVSICKAHSIDFIEVFRFFGQDLETMC